MPIFQFHKKTLGARERAEGFFMELKVFLVFNQT